jgi:hypothetical protein
MARRGTLPTSLAAAESAVVYRKGELSKGMIDRQWPHQVAVPADSCTGANWVRIQEFCKGMSVRPRGHFIYRDTIGFNVYCFGEREHAQQFCGRFNGEFIAPEERPRWPRKR